MDEELQAVKKAVVEVMEYSHPHRRGRENEKDPVCAPCRVS
jgi:hypothetical protein